MNPIPKEHPILFQAEMIRQILSGNKTQTRRLVKCPRGLEEIWQDGAAHFDIMHNGRDGYDVVEWEADHAIKHALMCPYGQPGDRLWLRERVADTTKYRALSRLLLEITAVRVERLQDISEADAVAEGVETHADSYCSFRDYSCENKWFGNDSLAAGASYRTLWESIHGPGSWQRNEWVWVVTFEKV